MQLKVLSSFTWTLYNNIHHFVNQLLRNGGFDKLIQKK